MVNRASRPELGLRLGDGRWTVECRRVSLLVCYCTYLQRRGRLLSPTLKMMATFELYRRSTIGMCLTEMLDEMVSSGVPELAIPSARPVRQVYDGGIGKPSEEQGYFQELLRRV